MLELGGEPALDVGANLGPEPEQQAPAADPLQVPGGLGHGIGRPREGDRDPGPQMHALGRERCDQQRQEGIVDGLVAPQPIGPEPLAGGGLTGEFAEVIATQADVDFHRVPLPLHRSDPATVPRLCPRGSAPLTGGCPGPTCLLRRCSDHNSLAAAWSGASEPWRTAT